VNEIKKRPAFVSTSIVVAISVLIDVGLHRLVDWAFHFNYFDNGLPVSGLVKSGLFPVAALLGFGVIFGFLALMYSNSRSELGGKPMRAGLRFFAPIAIIMFLGVIESWVVFDTPFRNELITAFADGAPFIVFGVLLSRIARPEAGAGGHPEVTRAPWTSMLWVALFYVAGRYFSYAILHITSGYVERAAATFAWTVCAGLGMGAFYWQAGSTFFVATPIRKALRVGALTLGTFFLLVQLFYALMFAVSVLDLVIRAVADSAYLVAGIYSFEKLFRKESYGSVRFPSERRFGRARA
jgi:hypothetical protein